MDEIRILIIDDEMGVCEMLVQFFNSLDFSAKYALNGQDALDVVQNFSPHFVFLDVMMPEMNGIDVLRHIREMDKSAKVIMISGMHDLGMAKEAMKLGAIDYIPKPIKLEDLKAFISNEVKKIQGGSGSETVGNLMQGGNDWDT